MRRLLDFFRNPKTRPRAIIWTGTVTFGLAAFVLFAIAATSTNWFCAAVCHEIQDDTIVGFESSVHANLSCLECHMPVNADPATFMIHKVEAGVVGMYQKLTKTFELPLNPDSALALEMKKNQCTQCHKMENRLVEATATLKIDHKKHMAEGINCPVCHNRVAHPEPVDGKFINAGMKAHPNYLSMTGCERCHGLRTDAKAPGTCETCHPKGFQLKPASHLKAGFYQAGGLPSQEHAKLAEEAAKKHEEAAVEFAKLPEEERKVQTEDGMVAYSMIGECTQCHTQKFCDDCHGVTVPHTKGFISKHGEIGTAEAKQCVKCHKGRIPTGPATKTSLPTFCDGCHHKQAKADTPWTTMHDNLIKAGDASPKECTKTCHKQSECEKCHVQMVMKSR